MKLPRKKLTASVPAFAMGDIGFLLLIFFVILARAQDDSHIQWQPAKLADIKMAAAPLASVAIDSGFKVYLDGNPSIEIYHEFAEYAGNRPVVAYSLQYDWERVLVPEWKRLGIAQISALGFCAYHLAQRLLDPIPAGNCKLQTLKQ